MATALAHRFEETFVEERIARLEARVEHIDATVVRLESKVDRLDEKWDRKFDVMKDSVTALQISVERGFLTMTRWNVGLFVTLATAFGAGFVWLVGRLP